MSFLSDFLETKNKIKLIFNKNNKFLNLINLLINQLCCVFLFVVSLNNKFIKEKKIPVCLNAKRQQFSPKPEHQLLAPEKSPNESRARAFCHISMYWFPFFKLNKYKKKKPNIYNERFVVDTVCRMLYVNL